MSDYFYSLQYLLRDAFMEAIHRNGPNPPFDSLIVLDIADEENQ